jgi:hypothetical protein
MPRMNQPTRTRRSILKAGLGAGLGAAILSRWGGAELAALGATTGDGGVSGMDAGASGDAGVTSGACVLDPTTTKGPYWVDERLNRSEFDTGNNTTTEATTQVFFDDSITDAVYRSVSPYSSRSARDTRNAADNIYGNQTVLLLNLSGDTASGFSGTIPLGVAVGQVNSG